MIKVYEVYKDQKSYFHDSLTEVISVSGFLKLSFEISGTEYLHLNEVLTWSSIFPAFD